VEPEETNSSPQPLDLVLLWRRWCWPKHNQWIWACRCSAGLVLENIFLPYTLNSCQISPTSLSTEESYHYVGIM
jgi:hypothetical protein